VTLAEVYKQKRKFEKTKGGEKKNNGDEPKNRIKANTSGGSIKKNTKEKREKRN